MKKLFRKVFIDTEPDYFIVTIVLLFAISLMVAAVQAQCAPQKEEFKNGNVWKPTADHNPNMVSVLKGDYPVFDWCKARLKNTKWDKLRYTGLGNPWNGVDRHHYRGNYPGKRYAGKKKNGGIRCGKGKKRWFFRLPGAPKKRHS